MAMATITVTGPTASSPHETVRCDSVRFSRQPFSVSDDAPRRQLSGDVAALVSKAYTRFRLAVRMSDGFVHEADVPAVTVQSIQDSSGAQWTAFATCGPRGTTYTNWRGEEFRVVFEDE